MSNKQVTSFKEATGVIQYNMTNDYMFRYILQKNQKVLKGLIRALLHWHPDSPEFYAKHMLMNIKNHRIYNDKFILSVIDLSKIELATEEDKAFQIDYWARLFKAKTWEELKMSAEKMNIYKKLPNLYLLQMQTILSVRLEAMLENK